MRRYDWAKQNLMKKNKAEVYVYRFVWVALLIIILLGLWAVITIDYSKPIIIDLP